MNTKRNKIIFYRTESVKVEFEINTINYYLKEIFKG